MSDRLCSHPLVPRTCWATAVLFLKAAGCGLCCGPVPSRRGAWLGEDGDGGEGNSALCLSGVFLAGWGGLAFVRGFLFLSCLSLSLLLAFVKTYSTSPSQKLYPASLLPFPNNLMDVSGAYRLEERRVAL